MLYVSYICINSTDVVSPKPMVCAVNYTWVCMRMWGVVWEYHQAYNRNSLKHLRILANENDWWHNDFVLKIEKYVLFNMAWNIQYMSSIYHKISNCKGNSGLEDVKWYYKSVKDRSHTKKRSDTFWWLLFKILIDRGFEQLSKCNSIGESTETIFTFYITQLYYFSSQLTYYYK